MITKIDIKNFKDSLKTSIIEIDVESAYRQIFTKQYQNAIYESIERSDGYLHYKNQLNIDVNNLRVLFEFKFDRDFNNKYHRAEVLLQALFYIKKFKNKGEFLPTVIICADKNEIFTYYAPQIYELLDERIDWSVGASNAPSKYPKLVQKIVDNYDVKIPVYNVFDKSFSFDELFETIDNYTNNSGKYNKIKVDELNLSIAYNRFENVVLSNKYKNDKFTTHQKVAIFISSLLKGDTYLHPNKPNILIYEKNEYKIDGANYRAFFEAYYNTN